ncbi:MAG: SRPBCC family protein [Sulfuritalea sp.]|nr:SRPBCC family protein [Sulfuritalea sp.]
MMAIRQWRPLWRMLALTVVLATGSAQGATPEGSSDIAVRVDIQGEVVRVEVELAVAATPQEVWDVITDFEHLPQFISNITSSKIIFREGNVVRVSQTGKTSVGPFAFDFQSVRELTLTPIEKFESRMLSGNMKRFRGTTQIEAAEEKTRIRYKSEAVPDTALPISLGRSMIESETREHYQEIRKEVLRRKRAAGNPPLTQ